eukprot:870841-Amphidinium_carterae.1
MPLHGKNLNADTMQLNQNNLNVVPAKRSLLASCLPLGTRVFTGVVAGVQFSSWLEVSSLAMDLAVIGLLLPARSIT